MKFLPSGSADLITSAGLIDNPGMLADFIASNVSLDYVHKQTILDELHPVRRIAKLNSILTDEIKIISLEREIQQKAQEQMDENQRNYMLREQMRAIANELGEEDPQEESEAMREKIEALNMPESSKKKLLKE